MPCVLNSSKRAATPHENCLRVQLTQVDFFPRDVIMRSKEISDAMAIGAYTDSAGNQFIRELVARGISARDSHEASPNSIFLSGKRTVQFWPLSCRVYQQFIMVLSDFQ